jgi:SAM-dependent methyltransferase
MAEATNGEEVARYYAGRTARILRKYGPGPVVHFHTGLVDPPLPLSDDPAELKRCMLRAQRALVADCARAWNGPSWLGGHVLDAGCGLGGAAIQWARDYGARVHALTNVAEHVAMIRQFAAQAGVGDRIEPALGDATDLPGPARFDTAVAIESSCYFDRDTWFRCLSQVLRRPFRVFVVDCFTAERGVARDFDAYWHTRIGSLSEYERAASAHGFRFAKLEMLNARVVDFWELSLRRSRAELRAADTASEHARLTRSIAAHGELRTHLAGGRIQYARLEIEQAGP